MLSLDQVGKAGVVLREIMASEQLAPHRNAKDCSG